MVTVVGPLLQVQHKRIRVIGGVKHIPSHRCWVEVVALIKSDTCCAWIYAFNNLED